MITGYHARVDRALGRPLLVFVELKLAAKSNDAFERVKKELAFVPEVMGATCVGRLRLPDQGAHFGDERLPSPARQHPLKLPSATESRSYVVMEEVKESLYSSMS